MAFTSSKGRTQSALADINITPLVDVVLVLLLIFMVTAPVLQSGIDVAVPQTRTVNQAVEQRRVLTLDKSQNVFLRRQAGQRARPFGHSEPGRRRQADRVHPRRPARALRCVRLRHGRRQAGRHYQHQHCDPALRPVIPFPA